VSSRCFGVVGFHGRAFGDIAAGAPRELLEVEISGKEDTGGTTVACQGGAAAAGEGAGESAGGVRNRCGTLGLESATRPRDPRARKGARRRRGRRSLGA